MTPQPPLRLGSGAQVKSQIHQEYITMCVNATATCYEPGLPVCIIPRWVGTDGTDRPSALAPERRTGLPMMGQFPPLLPNECLRARKVVSRLLWRLPFLHGRYCTHKSSTTKYTWLWIKALNSRLKFICSSVQGIVPSTLLFQIVYKRHVKAPRNMEDGEWTMLMSNDDPESLRDTDSAHLYPQFNGEAPEVCIPPSYFRNFRGSPKPRRGPTRRSQ